MEREVVDNGTLAVRAALKAQVRRQLTLTLNLALALTLGTG